MIKFHPNVLFIMMNVDCGICLQASVYISEIVRMCV